MPAPPSDRQLNTTLKLWTARRCHQGSDEPSREVSARCCVRRLFPGAGTTGGVLVRWPSPVLEPTSAAHSTTPLRSRGGDLSKDPQPQQPAQLPAARRVVTRKENAV